MNWITWTILAFLAVEFGLRLISNQLNLAALTDRIPPAFRDFYDEEKYRQSQAYLKTNTRFGRIVSTFDLATLLIFWFTGGFALVDDWVRTFGLGDIFTGIAYIGVIIVLKVLIDQPFSLYNTFVIEQKFGFNQTTAAVWIKDRIKGCGLALLLGTPLLAGLLAFFHHAGSAAWLWCWLLVTLFSICIQFIAPTWIMPLFNRFEPLEAGELKTGILAYAKSIGFSLDNVFVMDGSRRSTKSNAFFTGFGRHRRIVLFDTLIQRHTTDELVAVLAHEMGHYQLKHILKMMGMGIVQTGLVFYLMSLVITTPALFEAFYVDRPSIHAGLIFFGLLFTPVDFFLGLILQAVSRYHEFAADRFAANTTGKPEALIAALKKLSVDNLSNLQPHGLYVFLNYSHPPVLQRIRALGEGGQ
ncbi:MAG: peptidase M48 [Proteobacteria bacterium]|nr:MAG: peptidase M48 [Pseudomonadota bacterium]PIE67996.1 MAG: peptidase M48 [Deltaproteobacteria bacterium]